MVKLLGRKKYTPSGKKKIGRPTVFTKDKLEKLRAWFSNSLTDEEACVYAWVSERALQTYCEKHPDFRKQKELLKHKPSIKAKTNMIKSINAGNLQLSQWWLERKNKKEFSTRVENAHEEVITKIENLYDKAPFDDDEE